MNCLSPCCHAFVYYNDDVIQCTNCLKIINQLKEGDEITTKIVYNVSDNDEGVNMSSDLLVDKMNKTKRCATDITYELCSVRCPKCNSFSRLARDLNGVKFFVCSNHSCREVFRG